MISKIKQYAFQKYLSYRYNVHFKSDVKINRKVEFEGRNALYNNTVFLNSFLGFGSYVANNSMIRATKIGRFCAIGDNVRTGLGLHPTSKFVSIHPSFFSTKEQAGFTFVDKQLFKEHKYIDEENEYFVDIGNDVWIGNNVQIMDGIKIGDGAVLATGAVVTKDVEPYAIYGGVPAKLIKYRFDQETRQKLLKIEWWNKNIKWIQDNADIFSDINEFLNRIEQD
ncbi:2,3,4,5-tetrahydropyridine-2,6-dicarboxylate N-acetyltransferase [Fodinibius salicampi]|uniref:CatB-related O-acetyltransferase n=1 Tax=Fodinibius salicampi TaxID=1920655 RepID=UPI0030A69F8E